jgi:hypothetical protein
VATVDDDLSKTIKAHFIHEDTGLLGRRFIKFAPRVGDELRLTGGLYYTVTRLVWVYDEPESPFSRLNIGIKDAPEEAATTKTNGA